MSLAEFTSGGGAVDELGHEPEGAVSPRSDSRTILARRRPAWVIPAAVVVVVLVGAFAAWKLLGGATNHKVTGSLTLMSPDKSGIAFDGRNCAGRNGFTDITPGAQ